KTQQTLKFQIGIGRNFFYYCTDNLLLPVVLNKNFHRNSDYIGTSEKICCHIFVNDNMIHFIQRLLISMKHRKTENGKKIRIHKFGIGLELFLAISQYHIAVSKPA